MTRNTRKLINDGCKLIVWCRKENKLLTKWHKIITKRDEITKSKFKDPETGCEVNIKSQKKKSWREQQPQRRLGHRTCVFRGLRFCSCMLAVTYNLQLACVCVCVRVVMGSSWGCCRGRLGLSWQIVPQDQNTLQRIHSMRNISIYRSQWRANMLTSWHTDTHSAEGSWTCLRLDRKQRWRLLNLSSRTQFQTGSCAARPRFTSSQQ